MDMTIIPLKSLKALGPDTPPTAQDRQADVYSNVYVFETGGENGRTNAATPIMIITIEIN